MTYVYNQEDLMEIIGLHAYEEFKKANPAHAKNISVEVRFFIEADNLVMVAVTVVAQETPVRPDYVWRYDSCPEGYMLEEGDKNA